jgi:hypothetical protein
MTMFPTSTGLSAPEGRARVPISTVSFVTARNRGRLFDVIQTEFEKSGISNATLGARMGKGSDRVSRILGQPMNLTIDTIAEVLFAISGGVIEYRVTHPFSGRAQEEPPMQEVERDQPSAVTVIRSPNGPAMAGRQPDGPKIEPVRIITAAGRVEFKVAA